MLYKIHQLRQLHTGSHRFLTVIKDMHSRLAVRCRVFGTSNCGGESKIELPSCKLVSDTRASLALISSQSSILSHVMRCTSPLVIPTSPLGRFCTSWIYPKQRPVASILSSDHSDIVRQSDSSSRRTANSCIVGIQDAVRLPPPHQTMRRRFA